MPSDKHIIQAAQAIGCWWSADTIKQQAAKAPDASPQQAVARSIMAHATTLEEMEALHKALNERDLWINPEWMEQIADEIDCGSSCDNLFTEYDVNHTICTVADKGGYCPNDLAETLRAIAKVSPHRQVLTTRDAP